MEETGTSRLAIPACASYLRALRQWVSRQTEGTSLSASQIEDLLCAVDEAAANAIRHGSPYGIESEVHLVCHRDAHGIAVHIHDEGTGFSLVAPPPMPRPDATGGRGLPLIYALADAVDIAVTKNGTRVTIVKVP